MRLELSVDIGGLWRRRSSGGVCRNIWSRGFSAVYVFSSRLTDICMYVRMSVASPFYANRWVWALVNYFR